jgi:hypothetical protein
MRAHPKLQSAVALISTLLCTFCFAVQPTEKPFFDRLSELSGKNSTACGAIHLGENPSAALECARNHMAQGKPFWVAARIEGVDSFLWLGAAREPNGDSWLIDFDSDIHGGGGSSNATPSLELVLCHELRFSVERTEHIYCGLQGQP